MKTLKFLGILLIGLLLLASPANATGYRMIMMAGGVSVTAPGNDSYTKLLMHMEGTDDAQVFTDSSVGNLVEVDAGTGFSDAFAAFDGTGDYVSLADHADWDLVADTTDYTVEFWVKHADHVGTETYISQFEDADNNWQIYHVSGTGIYFNVQSGASSVIQINSGDEIVDNEWHHIALNKNSTVYKLYLDGVEIGTTTDASTDTFAGSLYIGSADASTNPFDGSIDEVRILDGVAQYDSAFTVPSSNFTSDANTALLLHMDLPNADPESFVDSGNQTHAVTQAGNAYQKARNLGIIGTSCGYFDGTGDYLSISDSADWDLSGGGTAQDFTVECWFKTTSADLQVLVGNLSASKGWKIMLNSTPTTINVYYGDSDWAFTVPAYDDDVWHHVAFVRESTVDNLYFDGVATSKAGSVGNQDESTSPLIVGDSTGFTQTFNGYIDDLRIVKGTAVYTANFNPPTTALSNEGNTVLLLHMDAGEGVVAVTDSSTGGAGSPHTANITENGNFIQVIGHGADANGNVKTENTTTPGFGTTSAYFDGTGDYIQTADSTDWDIVANTDNSTVDFWVKHDDHAGTETYVTHFEDGDNNWSIYHVHGTGLYFNVQSAAGSIVQINSGSEITDTDWHHIAVVKNATVYNLYLGGTSVGNTTDASVDTFAGDLIVGSDGTNDFAGYIDELRISKGIARWTANFTPPNAAYFE